MKTSTNGISPEVLGIVRGTAVYSPTIAQDFTGNLKRVTGGSNSSLADACASAVQDAHEKMERAAEDLKADSVIGVRYEVSQFANEMVMVLAYGTAVKRK